MTQEPVHGELLRALAAWSFPGAPPIPVPVGGDGLVAEVAGARLIAPLLLASEAGDVALDAGVLDAVVEWHEGTLVWCLRVERTLLEAAERFEDAGGVQHLVVKGPAIAHLDEADPSLRTFADIDLLVAEPDLDRAVQVLLDAGGQRPWAERRPGYDRRFAKSVTVRMPEGVEVDVHRSLTDGVHGFRVPIDQIFASACTFELGGRQVRAPSRTHRVLHAAYHAVLGSPEPKLMHLRDLAGYLFDERVDQRAVVAEAGAWRGEAVLEAAVREVSDGLALDLGPWDAWAREVELDPHEVAIVERQRREGSSLGRGKLEAMRELPGFGPRLAYGVGLVYPTRAHLRSRGMRRRDLLRRQR